MAYVYKIRRKSDGLFSTGGYNPSWTKKGKMWTGQGPLSNHLGLVSGNPYKDAELVTYEIVEQVVDVESLDDVQARRLERKSQREAAHQARIAAWKESRDRLDYERLKSRFG